MSNFDKAGFYSSLGKYLRSIGVDAKVVVGTEEDIGYGGCGEGTCSWEEIELVIYYRDSEGKRQEYAYNGSLSHLINRIA